MHKFLFGILALIGWLSANELALAQCCHMPMFRFIPPRFPTLITPSFPTVFTYPYPTQAFPTPAYSNVPNLIASPSLPLKMAVPKTRTSNAPRTIRAGQTLVRSPDELELKAKELHQKGITAEQEGNLFYAGTCYYQVFTSYPETSAASLARTAYTRIEADLERPKSK